MTDPYESAKQIQLALVLITYLSAWLHEADAVEAGIHLAGLRDE